MICTQCERDVAECICDDRGERLKSLMNSPHIHLGD